ncbi:hypothetical protein GCM10010191_19280 [Actinomadura vinacea]|uniref:Clp R domain-containing protein n=1 Tax=Actinomadura vinacea TaxID=115336 RepID=A0ABN3IPU6_9ACTN
MLEPPSLGFKGLLERAYRRAHDAGVPEVGTDLVLNCTTYKVKGSDGQFLLSPLFTNVRWRGESARTDPPPPSTEWEACFGEDVAFEAAAALGEAAGYGGATRRVRSRHKNVPLPVFSMTVRYAVHDAIARAADQEGGHAEPRHLVAAMSKLSGPAAELLPHWVPRQDLQRIESGHDLQLDDSRSMPWAVGGLTGVRVLPAPGPRLLRGPWRLLAWWLGSYLRRPYRRHGARYGHPMLQLIEGNVYSKALQLDHGTATAAHVLLSLIDLHEQLASCDRPLPEEVARWNQAGLILAAHDVRLRPAARAAARLEPEPGDAEHDLTGLPTQGWPPPRTARVGAPTLGRTALAALRQASLAAHRLGHPYAGTTHLLAALLEEPNGPAARLLHQLGIDSDTIRAEAAHNLESQTSEPR